MFVVLQVAASVAAGLLFLRAVLRHPVQSGPPGKTHIERSPSVMRTFLGGLFFGPVGALVGFAWQKEKIVSDEDES